MGNHLIRTCLCHTANNRGQKIPTPKNPWLAAYVGQFVTFQQPDLSATPVSSII